MKIRAIIIDDEYDGREVLKMAVHRYCPGVQLLEVFDSAENGMAGIRELNPDLVFLDVQMPHLSGFDMLRQLMPLTFETIFVTAHDHYAIKAIRFSALDYLLKPVDADDLVAAVDKVYERLKLKVNAHQYLSVLNNIRYKTGKIERLAISTLEGIEFFDTDQIVYCRADGSYTQLHLADQTSKLISKNLKEFESLLLDSGFCRVHHSYLINLKHIRKYIKGEGGYVILSGNQQVEVSRRRKDEFMSMLNRI